MQIFEIYIQSFSRLPPGGSWRRSRLKENALPQKKDVGSFHRCRGPPPFSPTTRATAFARTDKTGRLLSNEVPVAVGLQGTK